MLLLHDINHRPTDLNSWLPTYAKFAHELNFQPPALIVETQQALTDNITKFANNNCKIYHKTNQFITKNDLLDTQKWYTSIKGQDTHTGGSSTGALFKYRYWNEIYHTIESHGHYNLIAREFNINSNPHIAYLILNSGQISDKLVNTITTNNIILSHGMGQQATVHQFSTTNQYYTDYYGYFEAVINYLINANIDIILAPGNIIAALAWNIQRLKCKQPLAKLLSNTNEKVQRTDLDYLINNGNITDWCDHMRCWDGGATFMTCKYHTYHLFDGYALLKQGGNNELLCWDFFSLPAPFVNYWNGDYVKIGDDYKQCKCGRYYRDFEISRTRDFTNNYYTSDAINIILSDLLQSHTKRIDLLFNNFMRIYTSQPLSATERNNIRTALPDLRINFIVEEPIDVESL